MNTTHIYWEGLKVKIFKYYHRVCKPIQTQLNKLVGNCATFLLRPQGKRPLTKLNIRIIESADSQNWHTYGDKVRDSKMGFVSADSLVRIPQPK